MDLGAVQVEGRARHHRDVGLGESDRTGVRRPARALQHAQDDVRARIARHALFREVAVRELGADLVEVAAGSREHDDQLAAAGEEPREVLALHEARRHDHLQVPVACDRGENTARRKLQLFRLRRARADERLTTLPHGSQKGAEGQ